MNRKFAILRICEEINNLSDTHLKRVCKLITDFKEDQALSKEWSIRNGKGKIKKDDPG